MTVRVRIEHDDPGVPRDLLVSLVDAGSYRTVNSQRVAPGTGVEFHLHAGVYLQVCEAPPVPAAPAAGAPEAA